MGPPLPAEAHRADQLDVVRRMQAEWSAHLLARLRDISQALDKPFMWRAAATSGSAETAHAAATGSEPKGSGDDGRAAGAAADAVLHPYDPSELLERICACEHPNASAAYTGVRGGGLLPLSLRAAGLAELREALPELGSRAQRHLGADDELRAWYCDERLRAGQRALQEGAPLPALRGYARTGVPVSLRGRVWSRLLGLGGTPREAAREAAHYARLTLEIGRVPLLTDAAVRADVRAALDDCAFFAFAEALEEATLALCRDPWVSGRAAFTPGLPLRAAEGARAAFPPSGIVPFRGLASFACPLCYVSGAPSELYLLSRALWARHWSGLHALSAARGGLLSVLACFERLLLEGQPALAHHLAQLGAHPTLLAFDWLVFAFVGYLEVEQVLALWDRVLGYDSVDVLALAAAAIFRFRSGALLAATCEQEVADALDDASNLKIVPLMQDMLARP